jgi:hypothetical protein
MWDKLTHSGIGEILKENKSYAEVFQKINEAGLSGLFEKYLKGADLQKLRNFFDDMMRVDFSQLKKHKQMLFDFIEGKKQDEENEFLCPSITDVDYERFRDVGEESLSKGEWACLTLAGGSATRFFSNIPDNLKNKKSKALFPITPAGLSFLDVFAGEIIATSYDFGKIPIWIIIVSSSTSDEIEEFFCSFSRKFSFPTDFVLFIQQDEFPRLDMEGYPVVRKDGHLMWSGNGHGGALFALTKKISSKDKKMLGLSEDISYVELLSFWGLKGFVLHNVDNVLAQPLFPPRIGYHVQNDSYVTISVVLRNKGENLGIPVFSKKEGKFKIIEYSVAGRDLIYNSAFKFGHINTNLFSLKCILPDFLSKIRPVIYINKKVDLGNGVFVLTSTMEYLNHYIVEVLPQSKVNFILVDRDDFFAPTKTYDAEDSVFDSRKKYLKYTAKKIINSNYSLSLEDDSVLELAPYILFSEKIKGFFDFSHWKLERSCFFYTSCFMPPDGEEKSFSEGLKLKENSKFIISSDKPFGYIKVDSERNTKFDSGSFPKLKVGKNVSAEKNVSVRFQVEEGGVLIIEDGKVFQSDLDIKVRKGEVLKIT